MKDLEQGGEMGTLEDQILSPSHNTGQSPRPVSWEKWAFGVSVEPMGSHSCSTLGERSTETGNRF